MCIYIEIFFLVTSCDLAYLFKDSVPHPRTGEKNFYIFCYT